MLVVVEDVVVVDVVVLLVLVVLDVDVDVDVVVLVVVGVVLVVVGSKTSVKQKPLMHTLLLPQLLNELHSRQLSLSKFPHTL